MNAHTAIAAATKVHTSRAALSAASYHHDEIARHIALSAASPLYSGYCKGEISYHSVQRNSYLRNIIGAPNPYSVSHDALTAFLERVV